MRLRFKKYQAPELNDARSRSSQPNVCIPVRRGDMVHLG